MTFPTYDADGHVALVSFERDTRMLIGEAVDVGFDDLPEFLLKLDGIVGLCSELRALAERKADQRHQERAREEIATCIPPVEVGFNGGE